MPTEVGRLETEHLMKFVTYSGQTVFLLVSLTSNVLFDKVEVEGQSTRGGRPAWSTALRSGRSPYRFAGSNPAPRIVKQQQDENCSAAKPSKCESCPRMVV